VQKSKLGTTLVKARAAYALRDKNSRLVTLTFVQYPGNMHSSSVFRAEFESALRFVQL